MKQERLPNPHPRHVAGRHLHGVAALIPCPLSLQVDGALLGLGVHPESHAAAVELEGLAVHSLWCEMCVCVCVMRY